jgi:flagellar FliL protein
MARQEESTEAEKAPAKGRNNVMIIAGVIVLSAGIIGGGLFFGLKSHALPAAAEAGGEKKAEHAKKKEAPVMYPLEAFIVNISDGADIRYLKVKVELETGLTAETSKKELDPYLAKLRDAILVLLTTKTIQDVRDLAGKNRLREEILASVTKVVPAGKITSIYFTDFVVQ